MFRLLEPETPALLAAGGYSSEAGPAGRNSGKTMAMSLAGSKAAPPEI
jgi:hypothetical protein